MKEVSFWITVVYVTKGRSLQKWYVEMGTACLGVYIFQQFILRYLYYETAMATLLSPCVLP